MGQGSAIGEQPRKRQVGIVELECAERNVISFIGSREAVGKPAEAGWREGWLGDSPAEAGGKVLGRLCGRQRVTHGVSRGTAGPIW